MRKLEKVDIEKLDLKAADKKLYFDAIDMGAKIILLSETKSGYDIAFAFGDDEQLAALYPGISK